MYLEGVWAMKPALPDCSGAVKQQRGSVGRRVDQARDSGPGEEPVHVAWPGRHRRLHEVPHLPHRPHVVPDVGRIVHEDLRVWTQQLRVVRLVSGWQESGTLTRPQQRLL